MRSRCGKAGSGKDTVQWTRVPLSLRRACGCYPCPIGCWGLGSAGCSFAGCGSWPGWSGTSLGVMLGVPGVGPGEGFGPGAGSGVEGEGGSGMVGPGVMGGTSGGSIATWALLAYFGAMIMDQGVCFFTAIAMPGSSAFMSCAGVRHRVERLPRSGVIRTRGKDQRVVLLCMCSKSEGPIPGAFAINDQQENGWPFGIRYPTSSSSLSGRRAVRWYPCGASSPIWRTAHR